VSPWRWIEHTGWVLFEDAFLIHACIRGVAEIRTLAEHQAHLEATNREIEAQVREQTQELKESQLQLFHAAKLELVGRLAAGVAHEVKNPLAVTLLGVNYLEALNLTKAPEAQAVVSDMKEAICRADTVIRGLLDFAATRPVDMRPQPIHTVIDQALLLVRGDLLHAHVEIDRDYAEDIPLVRLDAQKVQQVLVNVFINACHAMPAGGQLVIRTWCAGFADDADKSSGGLPGGTPWVHVQVDDTGTGIPEDKIEKVFDPFFTTKPPGQGTGLGLSVSKRIMALHQASISLANRAGGGARATLSFPALDPETTTCPREESSSSMTK
jgi:signal transduction histidine kinase